MSTLDKSQLDFVYDTISNARSLMDNTHCYDTEEYKQCSIALLVLGGFSVSEATNEVNSEE